MSYDYEGCETHKIRDRFCSECHLVQQKKKENPLVHYDDFHYYVHSYHMNPLNEDMFTLKFVCDHIKRFENGEKYENY